MGFLNDNFLNNEAILSHLASLRSLTPVHTALRLLVEVLHNGGDGARVEEALRASREIDLIGSKDPDILTFIYHWSAATGRQGNCSEVVACAKLARSLAADASAASPLCFILTYEARAHRSMRDFSQFLASGHEALQVARDARPRIQPRAVALLCLDFAVLGRLSEIQDHVNQARRHELPAGVRYRLLLAKLIAATDAFRADDANRLLGQLDQQYTVRLDGAHLGSFMQMMLHTYARMFPAQISSPLHSPFSPDCVSPDSQKAHAMLCAICDDLQNHRPKQALDAVYAMHRTHGERFFITPGVDGHFLIRAELANGNASAAHRAMNLRDDAGLTHPIDSFFHARIALLEQGRDKADVLFRECLAGMDALNARNRILFELALSCELPGPVLMEWSRLVEQFPVGMESASKDPQDEAKTAPADSGEPAASITKVPSHRPGIAGVARLIGDSPDIRNVRQLIKRMADHDTPVLITGQTGTGKDVAALAIHEESSRKEHPYMAINCAALGENLLSSELFGHERGAFTGASKKHQGLIQAAGKGTLFLDEIGDIATNMQAALLRMLETGEFRPVGGTRIMSMQCRIVAATNRNLMDAVRDGHFREDLFYRLRRLEIHLPPLDIRKDDIPSLAEFFFNWDRTDSQRVRLTADLLDALMARAWPGNVRELRNTVERIRLFHGDKVDYAQSDLFDVLPEAADSLPAAGSAAPGTAMPPVAPVALAGETDTRFLPNRESAHSPLRREESALRAFQKYGKMTRKELAKELDVSPDTATRYLRRLIASGHIEKIMPSRSPRSHYFQLLKPSK